MRADLATAVPVGYRKVLERLARHLKVFQHAVIDKRDALGRSSFIIEWIKSDENILAQSSLRRIVIDGKKFRKDRRADLVGKRLAFADIFLAEAFRAMAEYFVEENGSGAARQKRGPGIWLDQRSGHQPFQFLAQDLSLREHGLIVRRVGRISPVKIVVTIDVHSIRRFSLNEQFQPVMDLAKLQACAFAGDLILIVSRRAERHDGIQDLRRRAKGASVKANFFFPRFAVGTDGNFRAVESARLFAGKIRSVFSVCLDLNFLARIDFDQAFRGGSELFVGLLPHRTAKHIGSVIDRHRGAETSLAGSGIPNLVGVVQVVASHANLRFEPPRMAFLAREQRAI